MGKANALHHIAIATADMKKQIEFFSDVLGMELLGLFWMHGVKGAWHAFLKLGDATFSLVFIPGNGDQETVIGQTHPGNNYNTSAPGTMQHIAFNVDKREDLVELRNRIRSRGVPVFGPMHHGFCSSIYFAGPENLSLEFATYDGASYPLNHDGTWIDAEVVELAGISPEELAQYRNPEPYISNGEPTPQPAYDPDKPHLFYSERRYHRMLEMTDEETTKYTSEEVPPNPQTAPAK